MSNDKYEVSNARLRVVDEYNPKWHMHVQLAECKYQDDPADAYGYEVWAIEVARMDPSNTGNMKMCDCTVNNPEEFEFKGTSEVLKIHQLWEVTSKEAMSFGDFVAKTFNREAAQAAGSKVLDGSEFHQKYIDWDSSEEEWSSSDEY